MAVVGNSSSSASIFRLARVARARTWLGSFGGAMRGTLVVSLVAAGAGVFRVVTGSSGALGGRWGVGLGEGAWDGRGGAEDLAARHVGQENLL